MKFMENHEEMVIARNAAAETIQLADGSTYFANNAGMRSNYPTWWYETICNKVRKKIYSSYGELSIYVNLLAPVFTYGIDTFATGYGYLFMNPLFMEKLLKLAADKGYEPSVKAIIAVYMHEIYHNVFDHMEDGKKNKNLYPDHDLQNCAMDYSINPLIERFYNMPGIFNAISGLRHSEYMGQTWKEIYPQLTEVEIPWSNARKQVRDEYRKAQDMNNDNKPQQGGGQQGPSAEKHYSEDYKAGYASQYAVISKIISNGRAKGLTDSSLLEEIENEAISLGFGDVITPTDFSKMKFDIKLTESVDETSEEYNKGVKMAWVESVEFLRKMLEGIQSREGDDDGKIPGQDKNNSEHLKNAVQDAYQKNSLGGGSSSNSDNGDSNSQNSDKQNDKSDNQNNDQNNGSGNSDNDSNSQNGEKDGKRQSSNGGSSSQGKGNTGDNDVEGDESSKSGGSDEESVEKKMEKILKNRGLEKKEPKIDDSTRKNIMEKHLDKLSKEEGMDDITKKVLKDFKNKIGEKLGMDDHESNIKWQDILAKYIGKIGVKAKPKFDAKSVQDIPKFGTLMPNLRSARSNEVGHIVIGLDNSGSVMTADLVPGFLKEIFTLFNNLSGDCVIDVMRFDAGVAACDRILHKKSETKAEIEQISNSAGGSTDYREVMYQMQLLMGKNLNDAHILPTFRGDHVFINGRRQKVAPASFCVIFTDSDFRWGGKYYGIDTSKLIILCINTPSIDELDLTGKNEMFKSCVRLVDTFANWKITN